MLNGRNYVSGVNKNKNPDLNEEAGTLLLYIGNYYCLSIIPIREERLLVDELLAVNDNKTLVVLAYLLAREVVHCVVCISLAVYYN